MLNVKVLLSIKYAQFYLETLSERMKAIITPKLKIPTKNIKTLLNCCTFTTTKVAFSLFLLFIFDSCVYDIVLNLVNISAELI